MTPATASNTRDAFHIPSLDGLRALSFLLVFVAHAGVHAIPGGFGVTVFFFLSGFLITTLMRVEHGRSGTVSLRGFYLRRALRILPPFYLVLMCGTFLAAIEFTPLGVDVRSVLAQCAHLANYWIIAGGVAPVGTGVYWSLAVEEHYYLVFPWAFLAIQRWMKSPWSRAAALYLVCIAVLAWRIALVDRFHVSENRTYMGTDTRLDSILYGSALALFKNPVLDAYTETENSLLRAFTGAGLLTLLFTFLYREPAFRETFRYSLQGLALTPIFVAVIRYPLWGPFRLLNTSLARFLGLLSYSLYLVHLIVISAVREHLVAPAWLRGIVALVLSVLLAWALHHLVERPAARLRKRLSGGTNRDARSSKARHAKPSETPMGTSP